MQEPRAAQQVGGRSGMALGMVRQAPQMGPEPNKKMPMLGPDPSTTAKATATARVPAPQKMATPVVGPTTATGTTRPAKPTPFPVRRPLFQRRYAGMPRERLDRAHQVLGQVARELLGVPLDEEHYLANVWFTSPHDQQVYRVQWPIPRSATLKGSANVSSPVVLYAMAADPERVATPTRVLASPRTIEWHMIDWKGWAPSESTPAARVGGNLTADSVETIGQHILADGDGFQAEGPDGLAVTKALVDARHPASDDATGLVRDVALQEGVIDMNQATRNFVEACVAQNPDTMAIRDYLQLQNVPALDLADATRHLMDEHATIMRDPRLAHLRGRPAARTPKGPYAAELALFPDMRLSAAELQSGIVARAVRAARPASGVGVFVFPSLHLPDTLLNRPDLLRQALSAAARPHLASLAKDPELRLYAVASIDQLYKDVQQITRGAPLEWLQQAQPLPSSSDDDDDDDDEDDGGGRNTPALPTPATSDDEDDDDDGGRTTPTFASAAAAAAAAAAADLTPPPPPVTSDPHFNNAKLKTLAERLVLLNQTTDFLATETETMRFGSPAGGASTPEQAWAMLDRLVQMVLGEKSPRKLRAQSHAVAQMAGISPTADAVQAGALFNCAVSTLVAEAIVTTALDRADDKEAIMAAAELMASPVTFTRAAIPTTTRALLTNLDTTLRTQAGTRLLDILDAIDPASRPGLPRARQVLVGIQPNLEAPLPPSLQPPLPSRPLIRLPPTGLTDQLPDDAYELLHTITEHIALAYPMCTIDLGNDPPDDTASARRVNAADDADSGAPSTKQPRVGINLTDDDPHATWAQTIPDFFYMVFGIFQTIGAGSRFWGSLGDIGEMASAVFAGIHQSGGAYALNDQLYSLFLNFAGGFESVGGSYLGNTVAWATTAWGALTLSGVISAMVTVTTHLAAVLHQSQDYVAGPVASSVASTLIWQSAARSLRRAGRAGWNAGRAVYHWVKAPIMLSALQRVVGVTYEPMADQAAQNAGAVAAAAGAVQEAQLAHQADGALASARLKFMHNLPVAPAGLDPFNLSFLWNAGVALAAIPAANDIVAHAEATTAFARGHTARLREQAEAVARARQQGLSNQAALWLHLCRDTAVSVAGGAAVGIAALGLSGLTCAGFHLLADPDWREFAMWPTLRSARARAPSVVRGASYYATVVSLLSLQLDLQKPDSPAILDFCSTMARLVAQEWARGADATSTYNLWALVNDHREIAPAPVNDADPALQPIWGGNLGYPNGGMPLPATGCYANHFGAVEGGPTIRGMLRCALFGRDQRRWLYALQPSGVPAGGAPPAGVAPPNQLRAPPPHYNPDRGMRPDQPDDRGVLHNALRKGAPAALRGKSGVELATQVGPQTAGELFAGVHAAIARLGANANKGVDTPTKSVMASMLAAEVVVATLAALPPRPRDFAVYQTIINAGVNVDVRANAMRPRLDRYMERANAAVEAITARLARKLQAFQHVGNRHEDLARLLMGNFDELRFGGHVPQNMAFDRYEGAVLLRALRAMAADPAANVELALPSVELVGIPLSILAQQARSEYAKMHPPPPPQQQQQRPPDYAATYHKLAWAYYWHDIMDAATMCSNNAALMLAWAHALDYAPRSPPTHANDIDWVRRLPVMVRVGGAAGAPAPMKHVAELPVRDLHDTPAAANAIAPPQPPAEPEVCPRETVRAIPALVRLVLATSIDTARTGAALPDLQYGVVSVGNQPAFERLRLFGTVDNDNGQRGTHLGNLGVFEFMRLDGATGAFGDPGANPTFLPDDRAVRRREALVV